MVVTSRDRLAGLTATEGAHRLTLDVLAPEDAHVLVTKVVGEDRVLAEPGAVAELAEVCAYLPLALRIASANLTSVSHASLAAYTAELRERGRLTALAIDGEDQGAVQAAFDLSYARLGPAARRLFRLLGLVPGPDFTPDAAAALVGGTVGEGRRLLDRLAAAHLVHQHAGDRYQFHDLLREYARMLARNDEEQEVRAAIERLLDFYLHTADAATRLLYPHVIRLPVQSNAVAFNTDDAAINWLESERLNLVAAASHAADLGVHSYAWQIADCLRGYFLSRGHSGAGLAMCDAALTAAKHAGDKLGESSIHDLMGLIHYNLSNFQQAVACHTNALELNRQTGNSAAEASSLHNLGRAHSHVGKPARAIRYHEQTLTVTRRIRNHHGEALALNYIGAAALSLGQSERATSYSIEALELGRRIGDHDVEARSLHSLGVCYWASGQLDNAVRCFTECLTVAKSIGNLPGEALTLTALAEANCDAGRYREADAQVRLALTQSRYVGERRTEAFGLYVLATIDRRRGDHTAADRGYAAALQLAHELGYFYGEISALVGLSAGCRSTGRTQEAVAHCQDALAVMRDTGILLFESHALAELAHTHLDLGHLEQASSYAVDALTVARERNQRLIEARTLQVLGLVRQAMGSDEAARSHWHAALEIFADIGTPEARDVRELLGVT